MKLTAKELKRQARESLIGRYGVPMAAFVLTELIILLINLPFNLSFQSNPDTFQMIVFSLASFIISLLSAVLNCGQIYIHLNLSRKKGYNVTDLFYFFTRRPDRIILTELLVTCIFLITLLPAALCSFAAYFLINTTPFYILTFIVWILTCAILTVISYQYHLVRYLLIELPEENPVGILRKSRQLMSGNKGRAFYISLSFIGMTILSLFSLGISLLWLTPYMTQTQVKFYQNIIAEIGET